MDDIKVSVFASTDVGMQRSGNEDAFLVADLTTGNTGLGPDMSTHSVGERGSLMIVSDGMGGAAAGEIASELAVTTICESLMQESANGDITERLRVATEAANERVWNHSLQNPELAGMGATVTAVLVQGTVANVAQVGDSRAYLIRGERVKQITKDQSLAQMLVDSGAIRPDQIHSVPQNVIMQALGTQPSVKVAMTTVQLCRNDFMLICSDGLSNKIHTDDLKHAVDEADTLMDACHRLIKLANERGGEDNITVIIAQFDGEALLSASDSQSITGSFRALNQEYVSDNANAAAQSFVSPVTQAKDNGITQMLTAIVPAPSDDSQDDEAVEENTLPLPIQTVPDESSTVLSQEFLQAEIEPVMPEVALEKKSYTGIIIFIIVALLLIAATLYFFYGQYLITRPQPEIVQPSSTDEK
jgi:serine/threonine protein phosphatase PrpC